jgi:hypothetical protein
MATDAAINTKVSTDEYSDILRDRNKYATTDSKQIGNRVNGGFDELVIPFRHHGRPGYCFVFLHIIRNSVRRNDVHLAGKLPNRIYCLHIGGQSLRLVI